MELNISEFRFSNFNYISYHGENFVRALHPFKINDRQQDNFILDFAGVVGLCNMERRRISQKQEEEEMNSKDNQQKFRNHHPD